VRIVVCDAHLLLGEALSALLEQRGHHVVARLASPDGATRLTAAEQPDLWLTELSFPGYGPGAVVRRLRSVAPNAAVIVLTASTDPVLLAAAAGADAVVSKTSGLGELELLLRTGGSATAQCLPVRMWEGSSRTRAHRSRQPGLTAHTAHTAHTALTAKELEVVARLAQGQRTVEVAGGLGVAVSTVRTHLQHLYRKLGVHSKLELVAYAVRHGLVRPGEVASSRSSCTEVASA
jgi:DNA-binding NarL/FixJ family response regulator